MLKWLKSLVKCTNETPVNVNVALKDYREPVKRGRPVRFPDEGTTFYYFRTSGKGWDWKVEETKFSLKMFHIALYKLDNFFLTREDAYANRDRVMKTFNSSKVFK